MKGEKVTLADIAKELNVSRTLISLVLNGKGDASAINKQTQKRVFDKAREMQYIPNQVARGLRMGKTNTIGLIVADISNPFFARITRTIEYYADKNGYSLIVCSSDENQKRETRLINMLINRQVDGIIMSSTLEDPTEIKKLVVNKIPVVLIDRNFTNLEVPYVGVDNKSAAVQAINHFLKYGHQKIGLITLTPSYISPLRDRKQGYSDSLIKHGLSVNDNLILELEYADLKDKQYSKIENYLLKQKPTAIFTTNNNLAVGCMEVFKKLNLSIPKDISLITFDDVELFKYTSPALSSIAQPLTEIGKEAVTILLQQLKTGIKPVKSIILNANLIMRES